MAPKAGRGNGLTVRMATLNNTELSRAVGNARTEVTMASGAVRRQEQLLVRARETGTDVMFREARLEDERKTLAGIERRLNIAEQEARKRGLDV